MPSKLQVISFVVEDMARSLAFYRHLNLDLPADADEQPHVDLALADGLRLSWDTTETIRSFDSAWTQPSGGHRMAIAFAHDTPAEVDLTYNTLVDLGYTGHRAPWDAEWGMRYALITDPDGNAVELFALL